jgi:hypothetical protein
MQSGREILCLASWKYEEVYISLRSLSCVCRTIVMVVPTVTHTSNSHSLKQVHSIRSTSTLVPCCRLDICDWLCWRLARISVDLSMECPSSVSTELIRAWTAARDPYVRDNWMLDVAEHPLPPRTQVAHRVDFGGFVDGMPKFRFYRVDFRAWTAARDPYVRDNWMLDVAEHPLPPRAQVAHRVDFGDTRQDMFFDRHGRQGSSNMLPSAAISFARSVFRERR